MKGMVIPIVIDALGTIPKRICKGTWGLGNKNISGDHSNNSIIKIGQNAEMTPVKNPQLILVSKILKGIIIKIINSYLI